MHSIFPYDQNTQYKIYPSAKSFSISDIIAESDDSFTRTLLARKSTRSFSSKGFEREDLSRLLSISFGQRNHSENPALRTYASAGGRYPVEVYVAIFASEGLEKGIYHYNVRDNTLELIKKGGYEDEIKAFYLNQDEIIPTGYPCLVLFSMVFERTMQKYGERGYRFILIDSGHMGQNLYLVATHMGMGVVALGAGAGNDNKLDEIIGLESSEENIFYSFAVGYPCESELLGSGAELTS